MARSTKLATAKKRLLTLSYFKDSFLFIHLQPKLPSHMYYASCGLIRLTLKRKITALLNDLHAPVKARC